MSCSKCIDSAQFDICLHCGEILKPISQNIQEYHAYIEKSFEQPQLLRKEK